jgi:hypothetical protein
LKHLCADGECQRGLPVKQGGPESVPELLNLQLPLRETEDFSGRYLDASGGAEGAPAGEQRAGEQAGNGYEDGEFSHGSCCCCCAARRWDLLEMCYQRSTISKIAGGQELVLRCLFPSDQSENAGFAAL